MNNNRPTIEIYGSIECPYSYLAAFRLRQLWPAYARRIKIIWRTLSLEDINRQVYPKPLFDVEYNLFHQYIDPALPWQPWFRQDWQWPGTYWPAFEALACAQAQGDQQGMEMSWALRHAYFAESRNLSLRHEVLAVAKQVTGLDMARFKQDWDGGRYREQVIAESQRGWHSLKLQGSATLVLPDGRRITNPAVGEIEFDESNYRLISFNPYSGNPLDAYREILDSILEQQR